MNVSTTVSATTNALQKFVNGPVNQAFTTTASCLSVFGTLVIFATFVLWKDLRTQSRKILVYLSVGDFLTALANDWGLWLPSDNITLCYVQGTINIAAILSSFFWTVYLSLYLYLSVCNRISAGTERRVMRVFHVTAWGIPLLIASLAAGLKEIGSTKDSASAGWCWIRTDQPCEDAIKWMLLAGKGWEILAYVAIVVFYFMARWHMRSGVYYKEGTPFLTPRAVLVAKKAERKFVAIPLVFIALRIWGTIRFFCYVHFCSTGLDCHPTAQKWLSVLHGIGDSSQGFANFILFCLFTEKIRSKLHRLFCRVLCCKTLTDDTYIGIESTNVALDDDD